MLSTHTCIDTSTQDYSIIENQIFEKETSNISNEIIEAPSTAEQMKPQNVGRTTSYGCRDSNQITNKTLMQRIRYVLELEIRIIIC